MTKETFFQEISYTHQLIAETMNLFIFVMFIKLFSAIMAMPAGETSMEVKTGSGGSLQVGGGPPLPTAQDGGEKKVNCGGHQAKSCAACPLVYTHHKNPHEFRHDYGHIWCKGECFWKDGMCGLKKPGAEN